MGKSDKKLKSEKLNFLRKQYEAFLEEDKKRKERNEYILGRLDEMRSCTALVTQNKLPSRILNAYQPGPLLSTRRADRTVVPLYNSKHAHSQFKSTTSTPFTVDIPTKTTQEALFLHEIVQKYILIPKSEYYSDPSTEENVDWKSKYEILNHLKDIEKDNVPTRDEIELIKTDRNNDIALKPLPDELPVKDDFKLKSKKSSIEIKTQTEPNNDYDYNSRSLQTAHTKYDELRSKYINCNKIDNDYISEIPHKVEFKSYELNRNIATTEFRETLNVASRSQHPVNKHEKSNMISQENLGQEKVNLIANKKENKNIGNQVQNNYVYSETETVNNAQIANENISPLAEDGGTIIDEIEYPMEMMNVSDFTPNDNVQLQDGVNVSPEGYHIAASMYNEPAIVNYGTNDYGEPGKIDNDNSFELATTPQNENYINNVRRNENYENHVQYNESTSVTTSNFEYNEPQTTIDDQVTNIAAITEIKDYTENQNSEQNEIINQDQEYTPTEPITVENTVDETAIEEFEAEQRDMFYQPQDENIHSQEVYTENYEENQHQYYEGTDQAPVEINEHEESTQPYDQNYAAQYGAYQQPVYEQQSQPKQPDYEQQSQPQQPGYEQQQQPGYEQQQHPGYEQQQQQPGYEQQQIYDQQAMYNQQQAFDQQSQPEGYEQGYYEQQQYDQSQYNQEQNYDQQAYSQLQNGQQTYENSQGIEQQLDNEQGYVEPNQHLDTEKEIQNDGGIQVVYPNQEIKEQNDAMKSSS